MFRASIRALPICAGMIATSSAVSCADTSFSAATSSTAGIKAIPGTNYFDTKGFPAKIEVDMKAKDTSLMHLAGVGMRRKNFYVASVDVYQVGCYVSTEGLRALHRSQQQARSSGSLTSALFNKGSTNTSSHNAKVMISLRFVRQVTNAQISDAFNESFADIDPQTVAVFKTALNKANASGSIKTGEELAFIWLENGSLAIAHQGVVQEV